MVNAMKDWRNKRVVILGAGRQGIALTRYLINNGADVVLSDSAQEDDLKQAREQLADIEVEWVYGGHPLELLEQVDLIFVSGGVPLTIPFLVEARARGIPLSNDTQLLMEVVPCPVIGITGSAGKTTTTTLVGRMARAVIANQNNAHSHSSDGDERKQDTPRKVWVGGNIGNPLLSDVSEMQVNDLVIIEISSFQLELMTISPQIAAVLNVTPNHLDRHGDMQSYIAAKAQILEFQDKNGIAVLGHDDPVSRDLVNRVKGKTITFGLNEPPKDVEWTGLRKDQIVLMSEGKCIPLLHRDLIQLRGEHNLLNVLAACAIAYAAGIPDSCMQKGVRDFSGVPHRLQLVRTLNGVDWFNDSIATAPERAMAAIRSFDRPIVLLAGGRDKDLPWEAFIALVRERVDHLILFGEVAALIEKLIDEDDSDERPYTLKRCPGLHQAVQEAVKVATPGDVVLLSPGGTSFDEFRDFEARGDRFMELVQELS